MKRYRQPVWLVALFLASPLLPRPVAAEQVAGEEPRVMTKIEVGMMAEVAELMRQEDYITAEEKLREIVKRTPDLFQARQMLAAALISLNRYSDAMAVLESMLAENPLDHRVLNNFSWLLSTATDPQVRNPARALQMAQDAVLVAPGDFHVWSTLAEAHHVNANFEQAVKAMRQAVDLAQQLQAPEEVRLKYAQQLQTLMETAAIMALMEQ